MNEDQIKQKLADNLKANDVAQEKPGLIAETPIELPPIEAFSNNLPLDNMMLRMDTMDFLNVPSGARQSAETQNQVDTVLRWAADSSPNREEGEILEVIHRQLRMMGKQLSDDRLTALYRYVRLHHARQTIETQMKALNG